MTGGKNFGVEVNLRNIHTELKKKNNSQISIIEWLQLPIIKQWTFDMNENEPMEY